jgi:hypothetical protein
MIQLAQSTRGCRSMKRNCVLSKSPLDQRVPQNAVDWMLSDMTQKVCMVSLAQCSTWLRAPPNYTRPRPGQPNNSCIATASRQRKRSNYRYSASSWGNCAQVAGDINVATSVVPMERGGSLSPAVWSLLPALHSLIVSNTRRQPVHWYFPLARITPWSSRLITGL